MAKKLPKGDSRRKLTAIQQAVLDAAKAALDAGKGHGYKKRWLTASAVCGGSYWKTDVEHPTKPGEFLSKGKVEIALDGIVAKRQLRTRRKQMMGIWYGLPISEAERIAEMKAERDDYAKQARGCVDSALDATALERDRKAAIRNFDRSIYATISLDSQIARAESRLAEVEGAAGDA